eukprot:TRINITY_DN6810_c0_g1_i1.p1 TRINITY_DN6810_c0_g1~~TRINITY_DN6810_c0_g1_i1.p1  ORF type:complete len:275 (+),score=61.88 TRINITY_DN6810_c0_g1_i1:35-826(+)
MCESNGVDQSVTSDALETLKQWKKVVLEDEQDKAIERLFLKHFDIIPEVLEKISESVPSNPQLLIDLMGVASDLVGQLICLQCIRDSNIELECDPYTDLVDAASYSIIIEDFPKEIEMFAVGMQAQLMILNFFLDKVLDDVDITSFLGGSEGDDVLALSEVDNEGNNVLHRVLKSDTRGMSSEQWSHAVLLAVLLNLPGGRSLLGTKDSNGNYPVQIAMKRDPICFEFLIKFMASSCNKPSSSSKQQTELLVTRISSLERENR